MSIQRVRENLYVFGSLSAPQDKKTDPLALADSLFYRGVEAEELPDDNEAFRLYHKALEYNPRHTGALVNIGSICYRRKDWKSAGNYCRRAIEVEPGYLLARYNLATALDEQGLYAEAVAEYLRVLARNPGYADAHFNLAGVYKKIGEAGRAVAHYRRYLRLATNDSYFQDAARREVARLTRALRRERMLGAV